jgi:AraC family transcriptional activator of pobA
MSTTAANVPSFTLYGDPGGDSLALMHIETIAARSVLHDWEIADHRHDRSFQVLVVQKGQAVAQVAGRTEALQAPCFLCVPQGEAHGFRFEPGTEGFVVTLSSDFLARTTEVDPLRRLLTAGGQGDLSKDAVARIDWLATELLRLSQDWPFDERLAGSLFEALLRSLPDPRSDLPLDQRLTRFRRLLEQHLPEHRPVSFYAARVGLSQRSLARLCMQHFGCTPRQAISRRLALEAQRMLRHTAASVFQTSDALGFKDPSYFSRFYLRETGRRPQRDKAAAAAAD